MQQMVWRESDGDEVKMRSILLMAASVIEVVGVWKLLIIFNGGRIMMLSIIRTLYLTLLSSFINWSM